MDNQTNVDFNRTMLKNIDKLIDRYIDLSLDRITIFPDVLILKYHIPCSDIYPSAQRGHPKSLQKIATLFQRRGFDVEDVNKWGIRIVLNAKRVVYTLEQAERSI